MARNISVLWFLTLMSGLLYMGITVLSPHAIPDTRLTNVLIIFGAFNFCSYLVWVTTLYPKFFSPLRHLPHTSSGLPVLGHIGAIFGRPPGSKFLNFMNAIPNDGLIRFPGILNKDLLLLTSPKSLAEVLVHRSYDFQKPEEIRGFLRAILGDGLVVVESDMHKFQRKHLTPAFHFRHIKELYPIFWTKANQLARSVAQQVKDNPEEKGTSVVEINHWANKVTMDIIGLAGLGRNFNSLLNSDDELIQYYEVLLEPTSEKTLFFALNLILSRGVVRLMPWKLNQTLDNTCDELRRICRQFVRDKKELVKAQSDDHRDILSVCLKSNNFADEMLVDQLLTFLAAGHETTSSSFTWSTYLLSKHPEVQTRLREEIRNNLPSPDTPLDPTIDLSHMLESLPYLNAICNETLRLYPPVPITVRVAITDTAINSQPIPKGTRLYLSPWAVNRSPELWGPDAEEFRPERWIDQETGHPNKMGGVTSNYSNLTFLHGPRSCIGEKFARSELTALVAVFCGRFQIQIADPREVVEVGGAITTKPKNGMNLRLKSLDGW